MRPQALRALLALLMVGGGGALLLSGHAAAQAPSADETRAFMEVRERFVTAESETDYRTVARDLRRFLKKRPETIHEKMIRSMLFDAHAASGSSCGTLEAFASELLAMEKAHYDRYSVAQGYVENECQPAAARRLAQQALNDLKATADRPPRKLAQYYQTLSNAQRQSGQLKEASASLRKAEAVLLEEAENVSAPGTTDYNLRQSILMDLAQVRMQKGEEDQALALYRSIYQKAPNDTTARRTFEQALRTAGRSAEKAQRLAEEVRENAINQALASVEESKLSEDVAAFTLPAVRGDSVSLADQRGKITVLNFWASWCGPCMEEMPFLVDLHDSYEDQSFQVLSINLPDGQKRHDRLIERFGIEFPVLLGDEQIEEDYGVPPIPLTLILDKEGTLRYRHLGFETSAMQQEKIQREIEHLMQN